MNHQVFRRYLKLGLVYFLFLLAHLTPCTSGQANSLESIAIEDNCEYWHYVCNKLSDSRWDKHCMERTIFLYYADKISWHESRFLCRAVFHSSPYSDVLSLDHNASFGKASKDFKTFVENFYEKKVAKDPMEVYTSALCCPDLDVHEQSLSTTCSWAGSSNIIEDNEYGLGAIHKGLSTFFCTSLKMRIEPNADPIFTHGVPYHTIDLSPVICSYTLPINCTRKFDTTTTSTERITIPPKPPVTKVSTSSTTPASLVSTPIKPMVGWCEAISERFGIKQWPSVPPGQWSVGECPEGYSGEARWYCETHRKFRSTGPNITCQNGWMDPIVEGFDKADSVHEFLNKTGDFGARVIANDFKFQAEIGVMIKSVNMIQKKSEKFSANFTPTEMGEVTKTIVKSCDKILESTEAWKNGKQSNRVPLAETILQYVQYAGVNLGCFEADKQVNLEEKLTADEQSQIFLNAFNLDVEQPINFTFQNNDFFINKNISSILEASVPVSDICNHKIGVGAVFLKLADQLSVGNADQIKVNSEIVAFNYNNKTVNESFSLPMGTLAKMRLKHHNQLDFGVKPKCVYWDFVTSSWHSEGCWLDTINSDRNHSECVCNHLTNFAVLMDVSGRERPSRVKDILSIVCTSASNLCLLVIILMYTFSRELRGRRSVILVNLSACILVVNILVVFGLDKLNNAVICKSVSVTLLYALLASFSWMMMEGYNLYQMIIIVFRGKGRLNTLKLYLLGYGIPAVITLLSGLFIGLFGELNSEYFCWISSPKYPAQMWAVAAPATFVIITNIYIIIRVLKTVSAVNGARSKYLGTSKSKSTTATTTYANGSSSPPINSNGYRNENLTRAYDKNVATINGHSEGANRKVYKRSITDSEANKSTPEKTAMEQEEEAKYRMWWDQWIAFVKGYISLFFLMGITWLVYVLYIHEFGQFFSYVFIVLNGLQGVFIFITQFLLNKKAKSAMRKTMSNWFDEDMLPWSTTNNSKQTANSYNKSSMPTTTTNTNSSVGDNGVNPNGIVTTAPPLRSTSIEYF